jgi:hypothetical protein
VTAVIALSAWWPIGWAIGALVVAIAAALLLTIIALGRRIGRQAHDIVAALDGSRENTSALFDVPKANLLIDQITRQLRRVRTGEDA